MSSEGTRSDVAGKRLSAGAIHLRAILEGYCAASLRTKGQAIAFVSQRKLSERLGRSVAQVKRYLLELIEAKLILAARGYRGFNRYEMSRPDSSHMRPPDGALMSRPDSSHMRPPDGAPARDSEICPIVSDQVLIQQEQCAAAELQYSKALTALSTAGLPDGIARTYADADEALCELAAAYYAERASKADVTLGLLRDMLNKPLDYFKRDKDDTKWLPPKDSVIFKSMRDAELAANRAAKKEMAANAAAADAVERAAGAKAATAKLAALLEAWDSILDDGERRGIEGAVAKEPMFAIPNKFGRMSLTAAYPDGTPTSFRRRCLVMMERYLAAQSREAAWQALGPAHQAALELEARQRFALWAATGPGALRSICLMLMGDA